MQQLVSLKPLKDDVFPVAPAAQVFHMTPAAEEKKARKKKLILAVVSFFFFFFFTFSCLLAKNRSEAHSHSSTFPTLATCCYF